ncbi:MAG TPA: hypothetical protein VFX28_11960 [Methylomirabilota bacterium]|nr:hypothetical protein [Methylomirabilota bacterium]
MSALPRRTAVFLLVAAALGAGWEGFLALSAPRRIDPALHAALRGAPRVDVAVTLGFAPEDFHVRLFQERGVVSGVKGTTVLLNRVPPEDVRRIARYYWVRRIALQ